MSDKEKEEQFGKHFEKFTDFSPFAIEILSPEGNYVKTVPNRGWFQIIRCYSPTKGFFDKSWRPREVEKI
ncbi:MAG: hypothetical protein JSW63_04265 [Ignavibacterium sp.]|nr:MAG: hypothetical protein JSW63_04265 [Ignavibacterium sp.]